MRQLRSRKRSRKYSEIGVCNLEHALAVLVSVILLLALQFAGEGARNVLVVSAIGVSGNSDHLLLIAGELDDAMVSGQSPTAWVHAVGATPGGTLKNGGGTFSTTGGGSSDVCTENPDIPCPPE